MNPILKINDSYATDESISNYQTYSFYPITGSQLNNPGSITITVQNSDNFYHIANSWLEFEGQLVKASDGEPYEAAHLITFANNGILHLFDNIKYRLSSTEIESVYNPGTVCQTSSAWLNIHLLSHRVLCNVGLRIPLMIQQLPTRVSSNATRLSAVQTLLANFDLLYPLVISSGLLKIIPKSCTVLFIHLYSLDHPQTQTHFSED